VDLGAGLDGISVRAGRGARIQFGYRDADYRAAVDRYAVEARKFSLVVEGILDRPSCKLLCINGMEDSIFPVEDTLVIGDIWGIPAPRTSSTSGSTTLAPKP
jgi:hypothetical protein